MFPSIRNFPSRRALRPFVCLVASGLLVGYAAEAFAIDRASFDGGFASDARPGYGAERSGYGSERRGYGAERQYYGAENRNRRSERDRDGHASRYRSSGSLIEFDDDVAEDGTANGGVFPGFGATSGGSFVYLDEDGGDEAGAGFDPAVAAAARVIDVEAERLDRRSIGPSSVDINHAGATKIIRIASRDAARRSGAGETTAPALAPWTPAWERYCKRAHRSFDAQRGTFVGADGAARFCTGE